MPKGYLVANIRVKDKEKFAVFSGMAGEVIKAHGEKYWPKVLMLSGMRVI